ncbi:rhamnogalacturonan acetylesterase [Pedobacter alpinus]|uniref:Rhamnogalacturonan acetylesterase n=1 Tax=Pedobacter alpinus TaxID=1590643 RepID=A0ABW5TUS2_9SPHI
MKNIINLFVLVVLFISQSVFAQQSIRPSYHFVFGKQKRVKNAIIINDKSIYNDAKGYGFDFNTMPNFIKKSMNGPLISADKAFYFSTKIPEGNYQVKIKVANPNGQSKTTIKAESRRLMMENIVPKKGIVNEEIFIVNVKSRIISASKNVILKEREHNKLDWDSKLTLEFAVNPAIIALEIIPVDDQITVFLAGNSTVVNQDNEPWASWGQMIPNFFGAGVAIANHAESGLTLGSFLGSNRLDKIWSVMKKGDYLFIEFGHNDQKEKGVNDGAFKSYSERLRLFVNSFRERGGIPIIVTSTGRRSFDKEGNVLETLGDYPTAAKKVASELDVPLIDLNSMSKTFYKALGEEESKKAFVHYPANSYPNQKTALADNTHFNPYGAYQLSKMIVQEIINQNIELKKYIKNFNFFNPAQPDSITSWIWPESPRSDVLKPDGN